jgi:hypothetical protein
MKRRRPGMLACPCSPSYLGGGDGRVRATRPDGQIVSKIPFYQQPDMDCNPSYVGGTHTIKGLWTEADLSKGKTLSEK